MKRTIPQFRKQIHKYYITLLQKAQVAGGLGASKPVDSDVTDLVERQKANILKKICDTGSACPSADAKFVINSYKTQTVAGTNYFIGLDSFVISTSKIVVHQQRNFFFNVSV